MCALQRLGSCWPVPGDLIQAFLSLLFRDTDWTIKPLTHGSDCGGGNWSTGTKTPRRHGEKMHTHTHTERPPHPPPRASAPGPAYCDVPTVLMTVSDTAEPAEVLRTSVTQKVCFANSFQVKTLLTNKLCYSLTVLKSQVCCLISLCDVYNMILGINIIYLSLKSLYNNHLKNKTLLVRFELMQVELM